MYINDIRRSNNGRDIPEILAPAGTADALKAAVNAGCDAVYLGGDLFSARAYAGNFDKEAMLRAIEYCHLYDIKLYMTVNILFKNSEINQLREYMEPYYRAGLDGVIVQDVGVVKYLKNYFPELPIHASTQMSISSVYGARFLQSTGITRVVPARELTLQEIKEIKEGSGLELETFVHGAMCYAYSGKCLFSSFLGGRSGNRGRCAQPCRQCYTFPDGREEYGMSMKDMCTLDILPKLIDAGISSFKIEGRMKNPYYVGATVDAYRCARDEYLGMVGTLSGKDRQRYREFAEELTLKMMDIYNRGGFCQGYYFRIGDDGFADGSQCREEGTDESQNRKEGSGGSQNQKEGSGGSRSRTYDQRRFSDEKGLEMISRNRPNHSGVLIGKIVRVKAPDVYIELARDINRQDVLEIADTGLELTSGKDGKAGSVISLKGNNLRKIKSGMALYRTRNNELLERIDRDIISRERKITAYAYIFAREEEPLKITISDALAHASVVSVTVAGQLIGKASSRPVTTDVLIQKMSKTEGTGIELVTECDIDDDIFVPMSEFNDLRRKAISLFKNAMAERYRR